MSASRPWQRRRWLVDSRLQMPFASVLVTQMLVVVLLWGAFLIWSNQRLRVGIRSLVSETSVTTAEAELLAQDMHQIQQRLILRLAGVTLLACLVQLIFGIFASRKMAGSTLKIKRILGDLSSGRAVSEVRFREEDRLDELALRLNAVASLMNARSSKIESGLDELDQALQELGDPSGGPATREQALARIRATTRELHSGLTMSTTGSTPQEQPT